MEYLHDVMSKRIFVMSKRIFVIQPLTEGEDQ